MKILQINTVYQQGSTGKIAAQLQSVAEKNGHMNIVAYRYAEKGRKYSNTYEISSWWDCHVHNRLAAITCLQGVFSFWKTKRFLRYISKMSPDLIHLHNIHGSYINHLLLFNYIKKHNIPVVWTLHDCWTFTGHCAYFTLSACNKFLDSCKHCNKQGKGFGICANTLFTLKKKWFTGIPNMTIVTPSYWLADLVQKSFLSDYSIRMIHNGIDLDIFKPTPSDFREKYNLGDKYIILGVAFDWGIRKGLDVFVDLSRKLDDRFQIVLVGTNDDIDYELPKNIISIHRTNNQTELAEIYTAADIFVNPTREDNFPTVNLESLACGTPVITFRTGGSPESLNETCGRVVEYNDIDGMITAINSLINSPDSKEDCLKRARMFEKNSKFMEYLLLYESIVGGSK